MIECWIDSDMVQKNAYMMPGQTFKSLGNKSEQMMDIFQTHSQTSCISPSQTWFNKNASKYISVETGNHQTNKSSDGRSWHNYRLTFTMKTMPIDLGTQNLPKPTYANSTCDTNKHKRKLIISQHWNQELILKISMWNNKRNVWNPFAKRYCK